MPDRNPTICMQPLHHSFSSDVEIQNVSHEGAASGYILPDCKVLKDLQH